MLRYHGVLAAHSSVRSEVVPGREPPPATVQLALFAASDDSPLEPPPSRHPWDWLLRRSRVRTGHVFETGVWKTMWR